MPGSSIQMLCSLTKCVSERFFEINSKGRRLIENNSVLHILQQNLYGVFWRQGALWQRILIPNAF